MKFRKLYTSKGIHFFSKSPMKGFTLVELLVVISLSGIVLLIITQIFFRSIQASNRSQVQSLIKQNGQAILETLDKNIRNGNIIVCPVGDVDNLPHTSNYIAFQDEEFTYTRYRFVDSGSGPLVNEIVKDVFVKPTDSTDPYSEVNLFISDKVCVLTESGNVENTSALTSNKDSNLLMTDFEFVITRTTGAGAVVNIQFSLGPNDNLNRRLASPLDPVAFVTTVEVR